MDDGKLRMILIAGICSSSNTSEIIGYRVLQYFLNKEGTKVQDVPTQSLVKFIASSGVKLENAIIVKGNLFGTQGSLSRLPVITVKGQLVSNGSVIILNRIGDVGFRISDFAGKTIKVREKDLIAAVNKQSITLANAKKVSRDGTEFISAISGDYDTVEIQQQAKTKIEASKLMGTNSVNTQRAMNIQQDIVNTEISNNDVFNVLGKEARQAIEAYYTWWTTSTFNDLVQDSRDRLQANPEKMRKIAALKGTDIKWAYAGSRYAITYSPSGYDQCTLGHKLKIVHLAKGIDSNNKVYVIKFGSTCVGDFFSVSQKGIRTLVSVTNTMKDEIDYIVKVFSNKEVDKAFKDVSLMDTLIDAARAQGNAQEKLSCLFGDKLATFLLLFNQVRVPYPLSLLRLSRKHSEKLFNGNQFLFWKAYFAGFEGADEALTNIAKKVYKKRFSYIDNFEFENIKANNYRSLVGTLSSISKQSMYKEREYERMCCIESVLKYLYESSLEGIYGYNVQRRTGEKGKGRFTKQRAAVMWRIEKTMDILMDGDITVYSMSRMLIEVSRTLKLLDKTNELVDYIQKKFEENLKKVMSTYRIFDEILSCLSRRTDYKNKSTEYYFKYIPVAKGFLSGYYSRSPVTKSLHSISKEELDNGYKEAVSVLKELEDNFIAKYMHRYRLIYKRGNGEFNNHIDLQVFYKYALPTNLYNYIKSHKDITDFVVHDKLDNTDIMDTREYEYTVYNSITDSLRTCNADELVEGINNKVILKNGVRQDI